jgi:quercetin dioxygenase-like cupin family protein
MSRFAPKAAAVLSICVALLGATEPAAAQDVIVKAENVAWKAHPLFPGAQQAVVVGDPAKAETIVQRLKFPPGAKVPPHTHPYGEVVTVLSGTLGLGAGDKFDPAKGQLLKAGSVFTNKAGQPHFVWTTNEEVVVQIVFTGPGGITFSNPADDPRKK